MGQLPRLRTSLDCRPKEAPILAMLSPQLFGPPYFDLPKKRPQIEKLPVAFEIWGRSAPQKAKSLCGAQAWSIQAKRNSGWHPHKDLQTGNEFGVWWIFAGTFELFYRQFYRLGGMVFCFRLWARSMQSISLTWSFVALSFALSEVNDIFLHLFALNPFLESPLAASRYSGRLKSAHLYLYCQFGCSFTACLPGSVTFFWLSFLLPAVGS